ncbi:MAG TPA: hypothetical protein VF552_04830 [Allosphingosinicella sp.]
MSARSFKSVGWVAGVGAAALGCYMLSLQVAAERAELASVERRIVAAQQEIRGLQTELGTRGRLQQLEQWNADVLALSAPAAGQFVENEVVLARLEQRPTDELPGGATVRMASAEAAPAAAPASPAAPVDARPQVRTAVAQAPAEPERPVVRRASLTTSSTPAPAPAATRSTAARPAPAAAKTPAPARSAALLDARTARAIGEAARSETRATRPAATATSRPTAIAPSRTTAAAASRPAAAAPARATPVRRTAETASRTPPKN